MNSVTNFLTTTRITALLYLGIALCGIVSFLVVRNQIYIDANASATVANLIEKEDLARIGIVAELALVIFQAATAIWFYKLFYIKNSLAAGLLAAFGLVNSIVILIASGLWVSALNAALSGDSVTIAYYLCNIHESLWLVANVFFGLWLLPMGYLANSAKIPKVLSLLLFVGGIGYIIAAVVFVLMPNQKIITGLLPLPATIGEFWMIGYLIATPKLK